MRYSQERSQARLDAALFSPNAAAGPAGWSAREKFTAVPSVPSA